MGSLLTRGSTVQPRKRRAFQEGRIAAEDQPHEVFEHGLVDVGTGEFQRDAFEAIDVDQRHGDEPVR